MNVVSSHLVTKYHIPCTATVIKQLSQQLKASLQERYMAPLSYLNIDRARKEWKLVKSILRKLKKAKLVLRVTDKSGIFHIGHDVDYEKKALAYQERTKAYIELPENPLWEVFDKVIHLLNNLRSKDHIRAGDLTKMMPKRDKVQLGYLYFVPKPHKVSTDLSLFSSRICEANHSYLVWFFKEGTPLRPIISSMNTPTTGISKFLDKLLRPLFEKHVRETTILDGVDLIQRLEQYAERGRLQSSTVFCTFDITDLYTMIPQEQSLDILVQFLVHFGYKKVNNIPIDAIRKLARIVIEENVFTYNNKFYKQVVGGAMGSAFTLTLANIFMWKWERTLFRMQSAEDEIYVR